MRIKAFILTSAILLFSCSLKQNNLVMPPKAEEGLVVSLSGGLEGKGKSSQPWKELKCGDLIKTGQTVRMSQGEAYLQTGTGIIINMKDESEITYSYDRREDTTTVEVLSGKVSFFNPGVILHVVQQDLFLFSQGGIFSLNRKNEIREIYNKEGDLRLLPGIEDPQLLKELLNEKNQHIAEEMVENQQPLFPGETWYLEENLLREQGKKYSDLILGLQAEDEQEEAAELEERVKEILSMNITISEYSQIEMDSIIEGFTLFDQSASLPRFLLLLSTEEGASIKVPHSLGEKSMEFILPLDYKVEVSISKPGYQSLTAEVFPEEIDELIDTRYFKLPRLTSRQVTLNVSPPESEIRINGIFAGKGNLALELKPDEPLELYLTLDGYNEQYLYLDVVIEWPELIEVELKKTIENNFKGAYQEVTGLAAQGDEIFLADWGGVIWFINEPSRWRRFNIRTNNYPNNYSPPVFSDNYVYYSGKRSLVVMNRHSGAVLSVTRLNDRENHLKGQRVVTLDYQVLFPTKDSIRFLSGDGSKIREVFIPGGSLMTPSVYGGKIYTVATDGQVYEISSFGQILRSLVTGTETPVAQSIVFDDNRGYFTDSQGIVVAFSPRKMSLEWVSEPLGTRSYLWDSQLSPENVFIYDGNFLHLLDRNTGKYLFKLNSQIYTQPLLMGEYIYAITDDEILTVFSASEGKLIKNINLGSKVTTPIYPYGERLMAGTNDGMVLILNQLDPSLLSRPMK